MDLARKFSHDSIRVLDFLKSFHYGLASEALIYALMRVPNTSVFETFLAQSRGRGNAIISLFKQLHCRDTSPFSELSFKLNKGMTVKRYSSEKESEDLLFLMMPHLHCAAHCAKAEGLEHITPRHLAIASLQDWTKSTPNQPVLKPPDELPNKALCDSGINVKNLWDALLCNLPFPVEPEILKANYQILIWPQASGFKVYRLEQLGKQQILDDRTETKFISNVSVLSPFQVFSDSDILELEELINSRAAKENDLQHFFEKHPQFLLHDNYSYLYPQLCFTNADSTIGNLRPDFILQNPANLMCEIWDLKLPFARITKGVAKRRTYSSHVWSAIAQLREYKTFFDDSSNRRLFAKSHGLQVYKPNLAVIIGRSSDFTGIRDRAVLQAQTDVRLITYDDILEIARHNRVIKRIMDNH